MSDSALGPRGPWIQTYSGRKFYFYTAGQEDFDLVDIAHGLSNVCRWMGQSKHFYSVAQHSVLLSLYVPKGYQMYALFHDAHEAYLGDLCTPLKRHTLLGKHYEELADRIQPLIEDAFQVLVPDNLDLFRSLDSRMCAAESRVLCQNDFAGDEGWLMSSDPLDVTISPWTAENAKRAFLKRYRDLERGREEGKFMADSGMYF